jgi:hypothetical protein
MTTNTTLAVAGSRQADIAASATRAVAHRIRDALTMPLSIDDGYFT